MAVVVAAALVALASCNDVEESDLVSDDQPFPDSGLTGSSGAPSSSGTPPDAGIATDAALPDAAPRGPLDPNYEHYARNYVMCTGQSLSVGAQGAPVLSDEQPYDSQMFVGGVVPPNSVAARLSFVPLVEGPSVETMQSGFANRAHELAAPLLIMRPVAEQSHRLFVSCHGVGGYSYTQLKKGTAPYTNGIAQLEAAVALSSTEGASLVVRGVSNVHGESDEANDASPEYEGSVVQWQQDLETDVKARTGQTLGVPMFHSQMSSFTKFGAVISDVALAQLKAHVEHPRVHVLVGPKYFLPYAADGVHLVNEGYRWLGEYYAKAYQREILEGYPWEPLRPLGATRAGAVITIEFLVPAPPLQLDTALVSDPGSYGFTFVDGSGAPPAITSVVITDATHVTLTLAQEPLGPAPVVRYAFNQPLTTPAGPTSGPRGNLRDSDATPSSHGVALYNWAVHFALATP